MARWSRFGRRARQSALGAVVVLAGVGVLPATTGADQVVMEVSSLEQIHLPNGYWAGPVGVNDAGSVVGTSLPNAVAIAWSSNTPTGYAWRPDGSANATLVAVGADDIAVGTVTLADPLQNLPARFSLTTEQWSYLPLPAGWDAVVRSLGEDGTIVADGLLVDQALPRTMAWPDPSAPPAVAPIEGQPTTVASSGRVLLRSNEGFASTWWDPTTGAVEPVVQPAAGAVAAADDLGRYLMTTSDGAQSILWDTSTGKTTTFDGQTSLLNRTGSAVGQIGAGWYVVEAATGTRTPIRPFGLDAPGSVFHPVALDDTGRVLGTLSDGTSSRVVVWSDAEHSVDIGPASGPGAMVPRFLTDDGLVVGYFEDLSLGLWRATFRLAPNAPASLAGRAGGATVALSWQPPTSPGDAPIGAYVVKADGVEVGQVDAASLTWSGTGDGSATYTVVAVNAYGESTPSNAVVLAAVSVDVPPAFTG